MPDYTADRSQELFAFEVAEAEGSFGLEEFENLLENTFQRRKPCLLIVHQKTHRKFYFATDPDGMYPYYFLITNMGVLIASSLTEICRREQNLQFSREWLEDYFAGRTDYSNHVVFQGVKLTLARCIYEIGYSESPASLKIHERRPHIWKHFDSENLGLDEVATYIKELVEKDLNTSLDINEKVALKFSSGSDSLFLAHFCRHLGIPVDLLSMLWHDVSPALTENYIQSLQSLGKPATVKIFNSELFSEFLLRHKASLPLDNRWINHYICSFILNDEIHRRGYSLVLNGEGGDEFFQHTPRLLGYYLDSAGYVKQNEVNAILDLCDQLRTDRNFSKDLFRSRVHRIYSRIYNRLGIDVQYALSHLRANDCFNYFVRYGRDFDTLFYDVTGISTGLSESYNYTVTTGVRAYSPLRNLEFSRSIAHLNFEDTISQMTTNKIYSIITGLLICPKKIGFNSNSSLNISMRLPEQVVASCERALNFMQDLGLSHTDYYTKVFKKSVESKSLSTPSIRLAYFGSWLNSYQQRFSELNENSSSYFLSFETPN